MLQNKSRRMYDALAHDCAMDAADRRELTPEQREVSRRMLAYARARLEEMECLDARAHSDVQPDIRAMDRSTMLARLRAILTTEPRAVFVCHEFDRLSDHALRSALQDAESLV